VAAIFLGVRYVVPGIERQAVEHYMESNPEAAATIAAGPKAADPIDYNSDIIRRYETYFGISPYSKRSKVNDVTFKSTEEFKDKWLFSLLLRENEEFVYTRMDRRNAREVSHDKVKEIVWEG